MGVGVNSIVAVTCVALFRLSAWVLRRLDKHCEVAQFVAKLCLDLLYTRLTRGVVRKEVFGNRDLSHCESLAQ